jgi:hypothetical protein
MPTPTYQPLATITLGASTTSVTFSSIPATYRDLILIFDGANTAGITDLYIRLNGDSTSGNYPGVRMSGDGSNPSSTTANTTAMRVGFISTGRTNAIIQIMDYSATDKHKTVLSRSNIPTSTVDANVGRWANTAAITSVNIFGGTLASASTVSLYGITS